MPKKLTPRQRAGRENRKKRKGLTSEGRERLRQSALEHRPWEQSTGPRTWRGKMRSRENAVIHGGRSFACLPHDVRGFIAGVGLAEADGRRIDGEAMVAAARYFGRHLGGLERWGWLMVRYVRALTSARDAA